MKKSEVASPSSLGLVTMSCQPLVLTLRVISLLFTSEDFSFILEAGFSERNWPWVSPALLGGQRSSSSPPGAQLWTSRGSYVRHTQLLIVLLQVSFLLPLDVIQNLGGDLCHAEGFFVSVFLDPLHLSSGVLLSFDEHFLKRLLLMQLLFGPLQLLGKLEYPVLLLFFHHLGLVLACGEAGGCPILSVQTGNFHWFRLKM